MPSWVLDEDKWSKAKEIAEKEGRSGDYEYITGIYKRMKGRIKKKNIRKAHYGDTHRIQIPKEILQLKKTLSSNPASNKVKKEDLKKTKPEYPEWQKWLLKADEQY